MSDILINGVMIVAGIMVLLIFSMISMYLMLIFDEMISAIKKGTEHADKKSRNKNRSKSER